MRTWTEPERKYLADHFGKVHDAIIAEALGRTARSVESKAYEMGFVRPPKSLLTEEEKQWCYELHYTYSLTYSEIAEKFEVSISVVGHAVRQKRKEHFDGLVGKSSASVHAYG